jgi:hypothetical protein
MTAYIRSAEGMTVTVTGSRNVMVTRATETGGYDGFQGLTLVEAEGLLYALKSAMNAAAYADNKGAQ